MAGLLPSVSTAFFCVCKLAHKPLFDENDELLISNPSAIRKGFQALLKEDASDNTRAEELWASAVRDLQREVDNETSPAAQGSVMVEDDFHMEGIPYGQ